MDSGYDPEPEYPKDDYPRDDYPRYRRDEEVMAEYLSGITKEEFGWTLEEKYNQIKPEERYLPALMKIYQSKES